MRFVRHITAHRRGADARLRLWHQQRAGQQLSQRVGDAIHFFRAPHVTGIETHANQNYEQSLDQ